VLCSEHHSSHLHVRLNLTRYIQAGPT